MKDKNSTGSGLKLNLSTLYLTTILVAACSIIYEFVIAQTLVTFAANTVIWYSVTVGVFLLSMGIGAILCDRKPFGDDPWTALFRVELLLTLIGASSSIVMHYAHSAHMHFWFLANFTLASFVFFATSIIVAMLVGLLSGFELPLLIQLGNLSASNRKVTNRVLAMDYIGSLIGSVLFPLVLLRFFEVYTIGFIAGLINLGVAVFLLLRHVRTGAYFLRTSICILSLIILVSGINFRADIQQNFLKRFHYALADWLPWKNLPNLAEMPEVQRISTPYQKVDIVLNFLGRPSDPLRHAYTSKFREKEDFPSGICLHLNLDTQFCSDYEEIYHEYFAHIPVMLNGGVPKRVLVIGAGDGILIKELLKYSRIHSVTHIDLDEQFVSVMRGHSIFRYLNGDVFESARVKSQYVDGFDYVRKTDEKFDAVYLDLPDPNDYHIARLYSREFYQRIRMLLNEGGYLALDSGGIALFRTALDSEDSVISKDNTWDVYYQTLRHAGFLQIVPFASLLETDNPQAVQIAKRGAPSLWPKFKQEFEQLSESEKEQRVERAQRRFIKSFVDGVRHGFIFAVPDNRTVVKTYRAVPFGTHVLNRSRFEDAFELDLPQELELDSRKVNSVFRPTLPKKKLSKVRVP